MIIVAIILASVCALLATVLMRGEKKNTALLAENNQLKGRVDTMREAALKAEAKEKAEVQENEDASVKPLSVQSIRTALRFNGFSPEITDTSEPDIVKFDYEDTHIRIEGGHLPYLSISAVFGLNEPEENMALLQRAAHEIVSRMFVGKAFLIDDGNAVVFSVEFIADYMYLRNNLREYVRIMMETGRRFYETYDQLKGQQTKDKEAVFSGESVIQSAQSRTKKEQA